MAEELYKRVPELYEKAHKAECMLMILESAECEYGEVLKKYQIPVCIQIAILYEAYMETFEEWAYEVGAKNYFNY